MHGISVTKKHKAQSISRFPIGRSVEEDDDEVTNPANETVAPFG
jgi:hypothetical protein